MTRQTNIISVIVAACLICFPRMAFAGSIYGAGSLGISSSGNLALAVNGTFKEKMLTVSTRYFSIYGQDRIYNAHPPESASDIALLAGISSRYTQRVSATLEVGLGYVRAVSGYVLPTGFYRTNEQSTVQLWGLALQSQLYWQRVGLILIGNINWGHSFAAMMISFRLLGTCN
jgi:hypothetical protein